MAAFGMCSGTLGRYLRTYTHKYNFFNRITTADSDIRVYAVGLQGSTRTRAEFQLLVLHSEALFSAW